MKKEHDIRIDRTLIHPLLDLKLTKLLKECGKKGIFLIITEGYRTEEYQDSLYAKGRTAPGKIVTNARGSSYSSQHQWGIAFDVAINDKDKLYDVTLLCKVGVIAKRVGLGWGGDWTSIVDRPHFYLKKWGADTKKLKKKFGYPHIFKKTWTATVIKTGGINLFRNTDKSSAIRNIPKGAKVNVLFKKLWYAKVRYKDKLGYVRKKYLK